MMRPALLVLTVAGCSSRNVAMSPPAPPAPVAAAPDAALATATLVPRPPPPPAPTSFALVADADVAWTPHKCHRTVWPIYDSDYTDDDKPAERYEPGDCSECGPGATLDDKARAIARSRPDEGVCDTRRRDDLEAAIVKAAPPTPDPFVQAWDHAAPLAYHALVKDALALTPAEDKLLAQTGFVVPERLQYADYTRAYYDVHRGQLPVYVTADSILHAIYVSHDQLLAGVERESLMKRLDAALGAMHCGLPVVARGWPADLANDVDLYLTVARSLLAGQQVPSELGKVDGLATAIATTIESARDGFGTVELFGRERALEATQYTPRGHYAGDPTLERYFRTAMWLSRTELDLSVRDSRSSILGEQPDPRETPREAMVALALAELADRSQASPHLAALDQAWTMFAGAREDVPLPELGKLRAKAGIKSLADPDAAERLRAAIGDGYKRTVNVHRMPSVEHLPVIATVLGARITPDTVALGGVVDGRGPDHTGAELGFMLGHDRALAYVDAKLEPQLAKARDHLIHAPFGNDLYSHWLEAIRGLAHTEQGALPSFMATPAFADLRLDSAITAYAQLRHNHVLIEAQVYDQGGCEIPDGYVEPALATYQALAAYAKQARTTFKALDPKDTARGVAYFTRLERLMTVLVSLAREELGNRPLSPAAKRFLAMIVERRESTAWGYNGTFPVATYDGWYIDLFPNIDASFKTSSFIADYATFDRDGKSGIHYVGAHGPRLGVFVVDVAGKPRVMVGPVATGFQHTGPLAKRLTDDDADNVAGSSPWAASYTAAPAPAPVLAVELLREPPAEKPAPGIKAPGMGPASPRDHRRTKDPLPYDTLRLESAGDLGTVTVELLDHHFVKLATIRVKLPGGRVDTKLAKQPRPIESLRVVVGAFERRVDLSLDGYAHARLGGGKLASDPD